MTGIAANLDRIIRPGGYISLIPHPPPRQPETQKPAVEEAKLTFGSAGQSVYSVVLGAYHELETVTTQKEVERTVDQVRVKNPDNKDQHVDVETTRRVVLQGRDGKKTEHIYAAQRESKNSEVIKKGITYRNPDTSGVP